MSTAPRPAENGSDASPPLGVAQAVDVGNGKNDRGGRLTRMIKELGFPIVVCLIVLGWLSKWHEDWRTDTKEAMNQFVERFQNIEDAHRKLRDDLLVEQRATRDVLIEIREALKAQPAKVRR